MRKHTPNLGSHSLNAGQPIGLEFEPIEAHHLVTFGT
jgi:hypothetical protein